MVTFLGATVTYLHHDYFVYADKRTAVPFLLRTPLLELALYDAGGFPILGNVHLRGLEPRRVPLVPRTTVSATCSC